MALHHDFACGPAEISGLSGGRNTEAQVREGNNVFRDRNIIVCMLGISATGRLPSLSQLYLNSSQMRNSYRSFHLINRKSYVRQN